MTDRWDDVLRHLPVDPLPTRLVRDVQRRLELERRRQTRARRPMAVVAWASAASGAWLLLPWVVGAEMPLPILTLEGIAQWLAGLTASPLGAAVQGIAGLQAWMADWNRSMDTVTLLALALLAGPACWGVVRLLAEEGRRQGWAG